MHNFLNFSKNYQGKWQADFCPFAYLFHRQHTNTHCKLAVCHTAVIGTAAFAVLPIFVSAFKCSLNHLGLQSLWSNCARDMPGWPCYSLRIQNVYRGPLLAPGGRNRMKTLWDFIKSYKTATPCLWQPQEWELAFTGRLSSVIHIYAVSIVYKNALSKT